MDDARRLVDAGVEHLSVYMLDFEKPCPMKAMVDDGRLELPPDGEVADAYCAMREFLPTLGLPPYEISNFSIPGCESAHNLRYWRRLPYLGLGPGAASHIGDTRWTAAEDVAGWVAGAGGAESQRLGPAEALAEVPLLALRLTEGVDWADLRRLADAQALGGMVDGWESELPPLVERGILERVGGRLRLTTEGVPLGNMAFRVFV
jgi:oxygen-independent coproporphyrinogen-3 oxidase